MRYAAAALGALALPHAPAPAAAGPAVDTLANCLVMNTSGADRVLLIRWVVFAFAAHPEAGRAVAVDPAQVGPTNLAVADLFMALLTERCPAETRAAFQAEGQMAFESAFGVLGEVASQELTLAPEVTAAMTGFLGHIDEARLAAVLQ